MQAMRFAYHTVEKNDLLWICFFHSRGIEYNLPCIVKETSDKEIFVAYGNIQPFSTQWVHQTFDQKGYEGSPSQYPTTFKAERTLSFSVKNEKVQPLKIKTKTVELQRYPVRLYQANPYHRVQHHTDYGSFDGTPQGLRDRVWELEKERLLPRFTERQLETYIKNNFILSCDTDEMCVRTLVWYHCTRKATNIRTYPLDENGKKEILKEFCEVCIPHLANKNWYDIKKNFFR